MAITVPNQWTATTGATDAEIITNPTSGNWLIAVITCRVTDGSAPLLNVGDPSRNLWTLLASPTAIASSAHASAQLQAEVWGCPAVRFDGWPFEAVYASAMAISTSDVGSVAVDVFEAAGMANGTLTVDSVTLATATSTSSVTLTAPAPTGGTNCLMVATAAADSTTSTTTSGTGWTALTSLTRTGPNLGMAAAWREATTGGSVTFSLSSGTANWAGVVVAFRTAGVAPAQPNPNWPGIQFQVGLGYDLSTPPSRVQWTDQTKRFKELVGDRGIQAELGVASQGQTTVVLDNQDGAYSPRTAGSATANATGTTSTVKVPDAQATNINKGDFFQLETSSGALKEFTVFQVLSLSSSGGTTTVTFTRADGSGVALAATASGDLYVGIPIDLYMPYRLLATWSGKTYAVESGWLRDVVTVYDGAAYSEAQIAATDAIETLTAANPSALRGEILRRKPTHYWPMDDASGSGYAANASGASNAALTVTASKYGTGSSTADFGASTQDVQVSGGLVFSVLGDAGTGWQSSGLTSADVNAGKGYALVGSSITDFPPISAGVTVFGVVGADLTTSIISGSTTNPTVFILRNTDPGAGVGQGSVIKLSIDHATGYGAITVWDKSTHASTTTTAATNGLTANFRSWAVAFDQTSWVLYADGINVLSGSANLVASFSGMDVGGEADQFYHGKCFPGLHAHVAVFGRKLTVGEIGALDGSMRNGEPLIEFMSTRIRRKLGTVRWRGPRVVNLSDTTTSAEGTPSGSIFDIVAEVAGYQDGLVFPDAAGQLQYRDRVMSFQQSTRAVLGEDETGGEVAYQPGLAPSFTPTFVYNNVEVDNTQGLNLTTPQTSAIVAVDDTSNRKYGTRTLPRGTRFTDVYRAWDICWWYLARYAYPQRRAESITIEAAAAPARWPFILGVEVGDLVPATKRHLGAPPYTIRCQVLRVAPRIVYGNNGQISGSVTLTLAAAAPPVPIANNPALGVVGGTVLGV